MIRGSSKYLTMFALVLALGLAVYMNWRFTKAEPAAAGTDTGEQQKENYGDSMFVSGSTNTATYFSEARLSRTQSRDQALDSIQKALQDTELSESEKTELTAQLTAVAGSITKEASIESLVKSKGFTDCMAYINGDSVKIVVACEEGELTSEKTAKITEIVLSQTDITADKISIVEVK